MSEPTSGGVPRLLRLIRKELAESLRDRRTIVTLLLMPVLLYPLLVIAFREVALLPAAEEKLKQKTVYRVGFESKEDLQRLLDLWLDSEAQLPWENGREMARMLQADPDNFGEKLAAYVESKLGISPSLPPWSDREPGPDGITPTYDKLETAVGKGLIDAGAARRLRDDQARGKGKKREAILIYVRERSDLGREAASHVRYLTAAANSRDNPFAWSTSVEEVPFKDRNSLVPVLVPLILILMTMTGAVYPAIDLTAGERERGTLEILVAAPIPRLAVLFAKYVAVLTVALLTALANLVMMALTLGTTGMGKQLFEESFNFGVLMQVLALMVLFAAFFSAVLLTLTSFARSFKEAQAYLIPLMLFSLLPGMLALMPGISLKGPLAVVPLMNIVLLARDLFSGQATAGVAVVVVLSTLVYALAAIGLAARIFGAEAVLSSEQSGWGDLFRRPERASDRLGASAALLCLALMFPIYFLFVSSVGALGLSIVEGLAWTVVGTALLFAGLPLLFLLHSRVRLTAGTRLFGAGWAGWLAALLLGASLWVWVSEVILLVSGESSNPWAKEAMERWRELSPVPLVLVLGLLVPVLEELFFRGVLFAALLGERGDKVRTAILGSAALFAAFHVLAPGGLSPARLVTTFLMGVVLGWLAHASGSVLPGMLLHVLHNSVIVLAGYSEPRLIESGWLREGQVHAPLWLLAATAVLALVGLGLLAWAERRRLARERRGVEN